MDSDHEKDSKDEIEVIKFSNSSSFNFGYVFISLALIISLGAIYFFWSANQNVTASLNQKKSEKNAIIAEITSPTYKDVEQNASDFKAAVDQLKTASASRYLISSFLTGFYQKITNDIQISSLAVSDNSTIAFSGKTGSYRSVADLMVALKTWPVLTNIILGTVSENVDDGGKVSVDFSMTANIDKTQQLAGTTSGANDSQTEVTPISANTTSSLDDSGGGV